MAVARPAARGWTVRLEAVGLLPTLFARLRAEAAGGPVAFGIDCPLGVPRAFARLHGGGLPGFPPFLRGLADRPRFLDVAETLAQVSAQQPFYPRLPRKGMTRLSHAQALGFDAADDLSRACDRATTERPAGAPVFWTLGANQAGKSAISAWRDLLLPAYAADEPIALWPFDGSFRALLRPGVIAIAETYPADALRQIGLRPFGSKRKQADRLALMPGIRSVMDALGVAADNALDIAMADGLGNDAAGEDRLDCLLGVLCIIMVITGQRPDTAPADPWVQQWEGWVLGQSPAGPA